MALTKCTDCASEISTTAKNCPKCGAAAPRAKVWPWVIGIPVALVVAFIGFGFTIPEYKARAREVRDTCLKLASYDQRHICEDQYRRLLQEGRRAEEE